MMDCHFCSRSSSVAGFWYLKSQTRLPTPHSQQMNSGKKCDREEVAFYDNLTESTEKKHAVATYYWIELSIKQ
jgi:hypothetical protein